jgi:hypothetical protein
MAHAAGATQAQVVTSRVQAVRRKGGFVCRARLLAVVDDVRPDDAFVVTSVGFTRDAIRSPKPKA